MIVSPWQTVPGLQEALETCLASGLSAGETRGVLNAHFKINLSRNACIGRARRTGVQIRSRGSDDMPIKIAPTPKGIRGGLPRTLVTGPETTELAVKDDEPTPRGDVDDGCRAMRGPSSHRNFCGAPLRYGSSYCEHHHKRFYDRVSTAASAARARQALAEVA